jgi:membrane protein
MWLSSLVLLVGAEMNALIEHRSPEGKRQGAKEEEDTGLTPRAASAPVGEPLPVRQAAVQRTAAPAPERRRPPVRGLVAIAAGLAAGVLIARREA